jgi:putative SOS response-associated peptidase YedK
MPLILKPEAYREWLDPENKESAYIEEVLIASHVQDLMRYPVSKRVNQVGNNGKECIEPLQEK